MLGGVSKGLARLGTREARAIATTSTAEAKEALKHVERLDRNRVAIFPLKYNSSMPRTALSD